MIASYPNRHFQLWEYTVSHGSLLVRSPRKPTIAKNIDIIFVGVEFISSPRHLKGVELMRASPSDVIKVSAEMGKELAADQVFILFSQGKRFPVVAAGYKIDENESDIFDSPFV